MFVSICIMYEYLIFKAIGILHVHDCEHSHSWYVQSMEDKCKHL